MILLNSELAKELDIDISLDNWLRILCENIEEFDSGEDVIIVGVQGIPISPPYGKILTSKSSEIC